MLTPAEAEAAIAATLGRLPEQELPLADCAGRVLRRDVVAERDAPPFDRVAMDGIAIAAGTAGETRREFRIAGVQPAGTPALTLESPSDCIEVMTGAMLPTGCDTVVPIERVRIDDGVATLESGYRPEVRQHVHRRASDAQAGAVLLEAGARLGAPEIAIAASAGQPRLAVSQRPSIAVISTGDELVEPGVRVLDHQIRRSNSHGLAAALRLAGFPPAADLHLPDCRELIEESLAATLDRHDVLVLSGGVSAGRFDHVPAALTALGVRQVFHHVAQRPGRPLWFGTRAPDRIVFALPGNPVSVLVCLVRYVLPALAAMSGAARQPQPTVALAAEHRFQAPLACFLPVALRYDQAGRLLGEPRPTRGSGDFISLAGSDGFVELPAGPATHPAGLVVPFHRW